MELRLKGKVAIVTGGASGIGRAVAIRLACEGAQLVIADIDRDEADKTVIEVCRIQRKCFSHYINLENVSDIEGMVRRTVENLGRLDILINAAGIVQNKPFLEVNESDWDRILNVNLKSVVFCTQVAARQMICQIPEEMRKNQCAGKNQGKIVMFSSVSGRKGRSFQVHYAASKAAIISITQSTALSLAPYGINVNAIAPGAILTSMWDKVLYERGKIFCTNPEVEARRIIDSIPLRRPGSPEEIAAAVAFLCSPDSDYITGQALNVDGGFEMN